MCCMVWEHCDVLLREWRRGSVAGLCVFPKLKYLLRMLGWSTGHMFSPLNLEYLLK